MQASEGNAVKRKRVSIETLEVGDVFMFTRGLPPNSQHSRVYYMKLSHEGYVQLTGPGTGRMYRAGETTGLVMRVDATLDVPKPGTGEPPVRHRCHCWYSACECPCGSPCYCDPR